MKKASNGGGNSSANEQGKTGSSTVDSKRINGGRRTEHRPVACKQASSGCGVSGVSGAVI